MQTTEQLVERLAELAGAPDPSQEEITGLMIGLLGKAVIDLGRIADALEEANNRAQ